MRRLALLLAVVTMLVAMHSTVAAASIATAPPDKACRIDVTPSHGKQDTTYRITGRNMPLTTDGGPLEVDMIVSRLTFDLAHLGHEHVTIYFVFMIPGFHRFYVDFNAPSDGEPGQKLLTGRYLVQAWTPHVKGCQSTDAFIVR
jgi:hypothetical protein